MQKGFSLLEILLAMSITVLIGATVIRLFQQNESVFHDQNLVTEMHQSARAGVVQTAGEIRMAGQGVPLYAASFDASPSEGTVAILSGSNATRINLRLGLAPTETAVVAPTPLDLSAGTPVTLTVSDAGGIYNVVGANPTGRFVFIWGDTGNARWGWVRASIVAIALAAKHVQIVTSETGSGAAIRFLNPPTMSLEEAVAVYRDSSTETMKRTTATNLTNPTAALWAPANDLVTNVTMLNFNYFDKSGSAITPDTLFNRALVSRVDIRIAVQTTQDLSNRSRPVYALTLRSMIRNQMIQ